MEMPDNTFTRSERENIILWQRDFLERFHGFGQLCIFIWSSPHLSFIQTFCLQPTRSSRNFSIVEGPWILQNCWGSPIHENELKHAQKRCKPCQHSTFQDNEAHCTRRQHRPHVVTRGPWWRTAWVCPKEVVHMDLRTRGRALCRHLPRPLSPCFTNSRASSAAAENKRLRSERRFLPIDWDLNWTPSEVNGGVSKRAPMTSRVLSESVLGLTLFVFFANDLPHRGSVAHWQIIIFVFFRTYRQLGS